MYDGVSRYFMPPAKQFHGTRFDDLQRGILREWNFAGTRCNDEDGPKAGFRDKQEFFGLRP